MQTQYEVKFLQSVFALKFELFNPSSLGYGSIYGIQMEWRVESEQFLSIGMAPKSMTMAQMKQLVVKAAKYQLIVGTYTS